jgi:hypothetical protein
MMNNIVEKLRDGETSIEAIYTGLCDKGLVLAGLSQSNVCYQLIFILLSWITMLFSSKENLFKDQLELALVDSEDPARALRTASWRKLTSPIEGLCSLPFRHLLARFGKFCLLPATGLPSGGKYHFGALLASNFSYETLRRVAKIRIQWVDSMTLHLEFDERTAVLKLFRFPSFCAMMCLSPREGSSTLLSQ